MVCLCKPRHVRLAIVTITIPIMLRPCSASMCLMPRMPYSQPTVQALCRNTPCVPMQGSNLVIASRETHEWYQRKFEHQYPASRRALVPLVW